MASISNTNKEMLYLLGNVQFKQLTFIRIYIQDAPYEIIVQVDSFNANGIHTNADNTVFYYRRNDDGSYDLFAKMRAWMNLYIKDTIGSIDLKCTASDVDITTLTAVPNS